MVRGVRPLTDIAAEFTMMMANRQLDPEIETVFLMADERFAHVSSSLNQADHPTFRRRTATAVRTADRHSSVAQQALNGRADFPG